MTRKDYVALARCFRDELIRIEADNSVYENGNDELRNKANAVVARLVQRVSIVLADDNPRFNLERFERAAYANHWDPLADKLDA